MIILKIIWLKIIRCKKYSYYKNTIKTLGALKYSNIVKK